MLKRENKKKEMFFGASPEIFKRASELRKSMTGAEDILWSALRRKQLNGKRFRRQHPIVIYIVDFYCHSNKLVIEVDGGIHQQKEQKVYDTGRSFELGNHGLKVIRFTNDQIKHKLPVVLQENERRL